MIKKKRLRRKKQNKFLTYFLLVLFALFALLPFYYLVITAFKDLEEAATQATMWPRSFALFENIKFVLTHPDYNVLGMFVRTMFVFVMKTTGTLVTCTLAAYAFARYKFPGKNIIFFVLLSTMMIPGNCSVSRFTNSLLTRALKKWRISRFGCRHGSRPTCLLSLC